jgi:hypothetical protein
VGGQTDPAGFQALLNDLENVGFTFGGQFAGHGVYVVGAARFVLTEYPAIGEVMLGPRCGSEIPQRMKSPAGLRCAIISVGSTGGTGQ